jgi:hypothetical protein
MRMYTICIERGVEVTKRAKMRTKERCIVDADGKIKIYLNQQNM